MPIRSLDEPEHSASVPRKVWSAGFVEHDVDPVAREEPLEIRLGGMPLAVVMRTPGADQDLVWGFVATERVVDDRADGSRLVGGRFICRLGLSM